MISSVHSFSDTQIPISPLSSEDERICAICLEAIEATQATKSFCALKQHDIHLICDRSTINGCPQCRNGHQALLPEQNRSNEESRLRDRAKHFARIAVSLAMLGGLIFGAALGNH